MLQFAELLFGGKSSCDRPILFPKGLAPLTVDASVGGILRTLGRLSEKDSSTFVSWEGKVVPW